MNKTKTFIIIPGNPPASYYYETWCDELSTHFPEYNFKTFSYPKFESNSSDSYLEEIVDFYKDLILSNYPDTNVNLIGHSVGGLFGTKLIEKIPEKIDNCFLIFPFFGNAKLQGRVLLSLVSFIDQKDFLRNLFVNNKDQLGRIWKELKNIKKMELQASTRLAHHEKNSLKIFKNPILKIELKDKLHLIYNQKDTWCSKESVKILKNNMDSTFISSVHDFIIFPNERKKITILLRSLI